MRYKLVALTFVAFTLTGCGSKWLNGEFYTSEMIQARDYAPYGTKFYPQPLYCYKTLATADCYAQPQAEQERQFIAGYPPAPPKPPEPKTLWESMEWEPKTFGPKIEEKPIPLG